MKRLIIGMGNVGCEIARRWRDQGIEVVGTTTTPSKVDGLLQYANRVEVVRGTDTHKIAELGRDCEAIVVCAAPNVRKATTLEERQRTYREVLVESCKSSAASNPRTVFLSSFSVYGSGDTQGKSNPLDENTPLTPNSDPSPSSYIEAEKTVLENDAGCVLRLPDIYGAPGDLDLAQRTKLAVELMGSRVPFSAKALFYRIHYLDVVRAVDHAVSQNLRGVYNVCDDGHEPPTNESIFNTICDENGWGRLEFLGHIAAPTHPISSSKLSQTGLSLEHTARQG